MNKHKLEEFNNIKKEIYLSTYRRDNDFQRKLDFFKDLNNNYSKENYRLAKLEVEDLMTNCLLNNFITRAKLLKAEYIPDFKGIPNALKYKEHDENAYYCLLDFEDQCYKFINDIMKQQLLLKKYYKIVKYKYYKNKNVDVKTLTNTYITLESIITLQSLTNIRIDLYERAIDDFIITNVFKKTDVYSFKLQDLSLYFDTINNIKDKKKVKSLRYQT